MSPPGAPPPHRRRALKSSLHLAPEVAVGALSPSAMERGPGSERDAGGHRRNEVGNHQRGRIRGLRPPNLDPREKKSGSINRPAARKRPPPPRDALARLPTATR